MLYAFLGMLAGLTGTLFGTVSASPWALFAIGNLLLLFALAMFDVIPVSVPQRLTAWAGSREGGSYGAVFVLGATSGVVAAPCGAPAFAAVLAWVAATRAGLMGFVYLFVFSMGMCTLLVAVGLFSGALSRLPKSGRWMVAVKRGAAVIMLGVAQYYFIQVGYNLSQVGSDVEHEEESGCGGGDRGSPKSGGARRGPAGLRRSAAAPARDGPRPG